MADEAPSTAGSSSTATRNAVVVLAVIAVGATMYWLSDILAPLALAMFLAITVDGFVRVLAHRLPGRSRRAALPLAMLLVLAIFGSSAFFIAENATSFANEVAGYAPKLNELIARAGAVFGVDAPVSMATLAQQLDPAKYAGMAARGVQNFTSTLGFVLIYAAFLIASRRSFERKMVALFRNRGSRQDAVAAFLRIRDSVERYLWVQTATGLMVAGAAWVAMVAVGLNEAAFWTFLIFVASYIPIIGGAIAMLVPPFFALLQFDTLWQPIVLFIALNAVTLIVGNIVYPRMQGRSMNMDPVVVLLSLAFWGSIWGLTGAFLSTPLTVMMMVILAQFDGSRWIAVLLSEKGDPQQLKDAKPGVAPDEPEPR
ncbi:AI-2E family transporter [Phenylobacterium sp. LjRoot219]|uniref:AI-2E family transporter n=1 Tax=Phenylobacterium sp. LjRoot219 TaxID=3342283 RepID=UPI003ECF841E